MQSTKHIHGTAITSVEYLCEQIQVIRVNGGHFYASNTQGSAWAPQTIVHKHHQRYVSESKFAFPKREMKTQENLCSLRYADTKTKKEKEMNKGTHCDTNFPTHTQKEWY